MRTIKTNLLGVAALGATLAFAGCGGGDAPAADTSGKQASGGTPAGAPADGAGAGNPAMAAGAGNPALGGAGAPGGAGPGTAPAGAGGGPADKAKPRDARVDPFKPWWDTNPPPAALELVGTWRTATNESILPEPERRAEVQEVSDRRVAGILTGNGAWALLDGPEGQQVVKPGDMVGEYRVESINQDSVVLKRKVGNRTFTQTVVLSDAGSSAGGTAPIGRPGLGGAPAGGGRAGGFFPGAAGAGAGAK